MKLRSKLCRWSTVPCVACVESTHRPLKMFGRAVSMRIYLHMLSDVFLMSSPVPSRQTLLYYTNYQSLCARTSPDHNSVIMIVPENSNIWSKLSSINELPILSMGEFFELCLRNVQVENVSHKVIMKKPCQAFVETKAK